MLAIVGLAVALRLLLLDARPLSIDNLRPYLFAHSALHGGSDLARQYQPQFGPLQVLTALPAAALARSLWQMLALGAVVHGLGALALGMAALVLTGRRAALLAAALYAFSPLLVLHVSSGLPGTYQVPTAISVAALCAAIALRRPSTPAVLLGALGLGVALHTHPYGLAPVLGGVVLLPTLVRVQGARRAALGAAVLAALGIAMVVHVFIIDHGGGSGASHGFQLRAGFMSLLQGALAPSAGSTACFEQLRALGVDPVHGLWQPAWLAWSVLLAPLLALPWLARPGKLRAPLLWLLASWVALVALGAWLQRIVDYHLAAIWPLHLLLGACGCAALLRWLEGRRVPAPLVHILGLAMFAGLLTSLPKLLLHHDGRPAQSLFRTGIVDSLARTVVEDHPGCPCEVAFVMDRDRLLSGGATALDLSQRLQAPGGWSAPPEHPAYVVAHLSDAGWDQVGPPNATALEGPWGGEGPLRLLRFEDIPAANAWLSGGCELTELVRYGQWKLDALRAVQPLPQHENWRDPCAAAKPAQPAEGSQRVEPRSHDDGRAKPYHGHPEPVP